MCARHRHSAIAGHDATRAKAYGRRASARRLQVANMTNELADGSETIVSQRSNAPPKNCFIIASQNASYVHLSTFVVSHVLWPPPAMMSRRRGLTDIRTHTGMRLRADEATCKQVVTCSCSTLQLHHPQIMMQLNYCCSAVTTSLE